MNYNGEKIEITSYLKQIEDYKDEINNPNNINDDLLDDYKYEQCYKCRKPNKFFCENCKKNICEKCKDDCYYTHKHKLRKLDDIKDSIKEKIDNIKKYWRNILYQKKIQEI